MTMTEDDKVSMLLERSAPTLDKLWWWHDCFDDYDPWGSAIGVAFALNDIAVRYGWKTDPTYSPGPFGPACEGYEYDWTMEQIQAGDLTQQDLEEAIVTLGALIHALDMLGRSY